MTLNNEPLTWIEPWSDVLQHVLCEMWVGSVKLAQLPMCECVTALQEIFFKFFVFDSFYKNNFGWIYLKWSDYNQIKWHQFHQCNFNLEEPISILTNDAINNINNIFFFFSHSVTYSFPIVQLILMILDFHKKISCLIFRTVHWCPKVDFY